MLTRRCKHCELSECLQRHVSIFEFTANYVPVQQVVPPAWHDQVQPQKHCKADGISFGGQLPAAVLCACDTARSSALNRTLTTVDPVDNEAAALALVLVQQRA